MRGYRNIALFAVATALVASACSAPPSPRAKSSTSSATGPLQLKAGETIAPRQQVNAFDLDGIAFGVDMFRVSLQSFMNSESPVLSFTIPPQADYVELMRCNAEATAISELKNAVIGVANNESLTRIVNNVNFWKESSESRACVLLASSVSGGSFYDGSAPTGSHIYLARACVAQTRLYNTDALGNRNCTAQVRPSNLLDHYQNQRVQKENEALTQMQEALAKADGIGRKLFHLTIDYNNALVNCANIKAENDARAKRFQAISTLFGVGASLGFALLAESPANSTVQQVWENRDAIANRGVQIATVLQSMYVNPSDYMTECRAAEKVQEEAKITTLELKVAHEMYNQYRDAANAASAQRQQLEAH